MNSYFLKKEYINYEKLLFENYLKLGIDEIELVILMHLFKMQIANENFLSIIELSEKTTLIIDDLGLKIESLENKGFIENKIVKIDGVLEEFFDVFKTLDKIIEIEKGDCNDYNLQNKIEKTKEIIDILEKEFRRNFSSKELEIVKSWDYPLNKIKSALLKAVQVNKIGIEYIDKILSSENSDPQFDISKFKEFFNE